MKTPDEKVKTDIELLRYCRQIATGMAYLSDMSIMIPGS